MNRQKGFTLVELLIVIALLGVLAAAVLAAINPLEQANRARDTRMRSDASQLLASIDRYFVTMDKFPWVGVDGGTTNNDIAYGFANAGDIPVGLCGNAGCTIDGAIIANNELKTEFRNRDFIVKRAVDTESLYIGKASGASSSVYACWVPKSKSERQKANKTLTISNPVPSVETPVNCAAKSYVDLANSCVVCLPQ